MDAAATGPRPEIAEIGETERRTLETFNMNPNKPTSVHCLRSAAGHVLIPNWNQQVSTESIEAEVRRLVSLGFEQSLLTEQELNSLCVNVKSEVERLIKGIQ